MKFPRGLQLSATPMHKIGCTNQPKCMWQGVQQTLVFSDVFGKCQKNVCILSACSQTGTSQLLTFRAVLSCFTVIYEKLIMFLGGSGFRLGFAGEP